MHQKVSETRAKTPSGQADGPNPEQSNLFKWGLPSGLGLSVFLVYLRTLAPTVSGGDSGEFVAVACATGVAHPPGYPLYTMLAKLFTFIPYGTVAWRVNLLSAICGSAAAVMIALVVRRWTGNRWAGVVAGGLFAFSPLVWRYAIVAEVFALNNLLVAAMIYTTVRYSEQRERRFAYATALIFGLGMSNHHTCLFYGIPLMLWILFAGRRELWNLRRLAVIGGCFLLGLLPYAYLPMADIFKPSVSWGNTSTLNGFVSHLLRREYGTLQLGAHKIDTSGNFLRGMREYFWSLPPELFYLGLGLALIGLYQGLRQKRWLGLTLTTVIAFCFYLITFHLLANLPLNDPIFLDIHRRFWPMANLMVYVWAGLGFGALSAIISRNKSRNIELAIVAIAIVASWAVFNFTVEDQRDNSAFSDFGRELFKPLPQGSVVWTTGDIVSNVMRYLQRCEGYRTDVVLVDRQLLKNRWMKRLLNSNYRDLSLPGEFYRPGTGGYDAKQFFDANAHRFPIFVSLADDLFQSDRSWDQDYVMRPMGPFREIASKQTSFSTEHYIQESERVLPTFNLDLLGRYPQGSWESAVLDEYWSSRLNRANFLISYAIAHGNDRRMLEAGAAALEDAIVRQPYPDPFIFKRLNLAYSKLAAYEPAYRLKADEAWSRYSRETPQIEETDGNRIER